MSFKQLLVISRPTISTSTRLWFQGHCAVGAGSHIQQHLYGQWLLQGTRCLLKDHMVNLLWVLFVKERTVTVTSRGLTFDSSTLCFQPRNFCCLALSQRDSDGLETGWGWAPRSLFLHSFSSAAFMRWKVLLLPAHLCFKSPTNDTCNMLGCWENTTTKVQPQELPLNLLDKLC